MENCKKCTDCGEIKPLEKFPFRKDRSIHRPWCRSCKKKYHDGKNSSQPLSDTARGLKNSVKYWKPPLTRRARKSQKVWDTKKDRVRFKRKVCIFLLGSQCRICGFSDYRALEIDHVDGNGNLDTTPNGCRNTESKVYNRIILHKDPNFQLLCSNCHKIKTIENRDYL